ncbi:hypothetical protein F5Y16DRAFT_417134 [Xylariaceae sp. FL0255]|nr:hypothetical protein F5Y16DRAFT_417134 [Xylariaceae sp. FL0255]
MRGFLLSFLFSSLLLASTAHAHFTVQYPDTIAQFDDDTEGQAPCGGTVPDLSTLPAQNFSTSGSYIEATTVHPQTNWLFRITTDNSAAGNWTQVYDIVQQINPGKYCQTSVVIPEAWVGRKAILGIVADGPDGVLYQCAAVTFVNDPVTPPSSCANATGSTFAFASDPKLSTLVSSSIDPNNTTSTQPSSTTSSPSASTTHNGAVSLYEQSTVGISDGFMAGFIIMACIQLSFVI